MNRKHKSFETLGATLVAVLALLVFAPAAHAAECGDVMVRLWQKNQARFFDFGEEIVLSPGEKGDLYLHYRSSSPSPYSTSSRFGYASTMGLGGGSAARAVEVVRLKAQSSKDVADGRVSLEAVSRGRASLGYQLTAVAKAGVMDRVPGACKKGVISLRVSDGKETPKPATGEAPPAEAGDAADKLLATLHEAFLPGSNMKPSAAHLALIREQGHRGAALVAMDLVASEAFKAVDAQSHNLVGRSTHARARVGRRPVAITVLHDIYKKLYGRTDIPTEARDGHLDELLVCLSKEDESEGACKRFGRDVVKTTYFAEHQEGMIAKLPESFRKGFD